MSSSDYMLLISYTIYQFTDTSNSKAKWVTASQQMQTVTASLFGCNVAYCYWCPIFWWPICWSHWCAPKKWLKRSRCHKGCGLRGRNRISDPPPTRSTSEGDMPSSQYTQSYSQGGSTWQCSLNLLSLRPKADTHYTTHSISVSYSTKNYNQTIYKYHQKNDELTSSAAKSTKASCRLRTSKRAALLSKTTKRWWTGLLCQCSKWCSAAKNTNSHGMDGGNLINTMEKWKSLTTSKCFNYAFHQNS